MKSTFNDCIELVLQDEGGYVDDPSDSGGETKYGISKKAYPNLDIPSLTIKKAKEIYFNDYWVRSKAEMLPEEIRYIHFDTAINMGLGRAARLLQRAAQVDDDGVIGSVTLEAAKKITLDSYAVERLYYYCQIVRGNPSQARSIGGWSNRVKEIIKRTKE